MKTITFFFVLIAIPFGWSQKRNKHNHETKPSNAREIWGSFKTGELIKTKDCDWKISPFGRKIFKKGKLKKGFEYLNDIDIYHMVYDSDGLMITGFMVRPKKPGHYPCIIYNRGGNRDMGALLVYNAMVQMASLAAEGYVVIASNYRGNSNSEGKEEFGGNDVRDVLNLIPTLGQVEYADTSKIGMFGISRGGMMTYLAMKESCQIKSAVVLGGLNDLFIMKEKRPDMESHVYEEVIPQYSAHSDSLLKDRSVTYWSDQLCRSIPLLMLHGSADKACDISMANKLHAQLKKHEHPHVFLEFKKDNHGCMKHKEEVSFVIKQWFSKYLDKEMQFDEKEVYRVVK